MLSAVSILALGYLSLANDVTQVIATAIDLVLRKRLGQVVCDRVSVDLSWAFRRGPASVKKLDIDLS
jgi:hypothetical protein